MEPSMRQSSEHKARRKNGRAVAIAATLLCVTALGQPNLAHAGPHGGGGGGFRGGGFHGGRFHPGGSTPDLAGFKGSAFTMADFTTVGFTLTGFFSASAEN